MLGILVPLHTHACIQAGSLINFKYIQKFPYYLLDSDQRVKGALVDEQYPPVPKLSFCFLCHDLTYCLFNKTPPE